MIRHAGGAARLVAGWRAGLVCQVVADVDLLAGEEYGGSEVLLWVDGQVVPDPWLKVVRVANLGGEPYDQAARRPSPWRLHAWAELPGLLLNPNESIVVKFLTQGASVMEVTGLRCRY